MKVLNSTLLRTLSLTVAVAARAEVREIVSYEDVGPLTDTSALIVFDLDNTIYEPTQTLGSDQWGGLQQKRFKEKGLAPADAVDAGVAMFSEVQMRTAVQLVEPMTAKFIADLQKRGFRVMGLTARPMNLVARTVEQLSSLGLDLSKTAPQGFVPGSSDPHKDVQYRGGVLFVGPHNLKGPVLKTFLNGEIPASIAFFDDKKHHVDDLEEVFAHTTNYVGYRYGAADPKVKSMSAEIGDFQWKAFKLWNLFVSDIEAKELLNEGAWKMPNLESDLEAKFERILEESSDGPSSSQGCYLRNDWSELVKTYACDGTVTSLIHGGEGFEHEVTYLFHLYRESATSDEYFARIQDL